MNTSAFADAAQLKSRSAEYRASLLSNLSQASLSSEFKGAIVGAASGWIQLFDLKGAPYAFFVPLFDEHSGLSGYSVISGIDGNNTVLAMCKGEGAKLLATKIIHINDSKTQDEAIAYEFPDAFFFYSNGEYAKIVISGEPAEASQYKTNTIYLPTAPNSKPSNSDSTIITVYGSLTDWDIGAFAPVANGAYYGGYQGWLIDEGVSKFWADRSCGVTAAANALYYMSQHLSGKSALYPKSNIMRSSFSQFQKQLFDYSLSPAVWGIPDLHAMKSKVESWASYKQIPLAGKLINAAWDAMSVREYIATGLNRNRPVLLLTWNSPIANLRFHWVTVTRIYKAGSDKILTSNWAGKAEYDFSTWVNASSIYKAVLYFE